MTLQTNEIFYKKGILVLMDFFNRNLGKNKILYTHRSISNITFR